MPYEAFQFLALAILFGGGAMLAWGTVQAAARLPMLLMLRRRPLGAEMTARRRQLPHWRWM